MTSNTTALLLVQLNAVEKSRAVCVVVDLQCRAKVAAVVVPASFAQPRAAGHSLATTTVSTTFSQARSSDLVSDGQLVSFPCEVAIMESSPSLTEDLSVFPPDDEEVILSPDQCFCCKLSKTQGTFFALKGFHDRWEWRPWEANVNKFRAAAGQGCRRCGFVFEVVLTYMDAMGFSSLGWVRVWNGANAPGSLRALVYINLSCANPRGSRTLTLSHSPGVLTLLIQKMGLRTMMLSIHR